MYLYTVSEYKGERHRTRKEKKTALFAVVRIGSPKAPSTSKAAMAAFLSSLFVFLFSVS
jgi:hypothetical protein